MASLCFLPTPMTISSLNLDEAALKKGHECLKYFVVFGAFVAVISVFSYSFHCRNIFSLKNSLSILHSEFWDPVGIGLSLSRRNLFFITLLL